MIYQPSHHGLLDLYGCPAELLRDEQRLTQVLQQAAQTAEATILSSHFHTFGGEGGVTGVLLLAESHISIHTWPERQYAALDIFMCGDCDPYKGIPVLRKAFLPANLTISEQKRGLVP